MQQEYDIFQENFELLVQELTSELFYEELTKAKKEYFLLTGEVYEDDVFYESRMASFVDWYVFDRPFTGSIIPTNTIPVNYYLENKVSALSEQSKGYAQRLGKTIHSLFKVSKVSVGKAELTDQVSKIKYQVFEVPFPLIKGNIVEMRLISMEDTLCYSTGACILHSPKVLPVIDKVMKDLRKKSKKNELTQIELNEALNKLAFCQIKTQRYRHVEDLNIYQQAFTS